MLSDIVPPTGARSVETGEPRGDRIAKWLARAGVASRRDAEAMLAQGVVRLNGKVVDHPATFVTADDVIQVNGKVVDPPDRTRVWRYHKPEGLVTTHKDPQGRPTVFEKLPPQLPRVVSVGRLDLNSRNSVVLTAMLTQFGASLIARYRKIENSVGRAVGKELRALRAEIGAKA